MLDKELYEHVLGDIRPWRVERVTLNRTDLAIEVELTCPPQVWVCPECHERAHVHDTERRRWRHLDTCQYQTILVADVPRVKCGKHGTVQVKVPWAEPFGRFTKLFERLAIDVMHECSTSAACGILRVSWDEADGIKRRAVRRGLARRPAEPLRRICVDEKSAGRGQDYVTVVSCADTVPARVLAVEDGREERSLNRFWRRLSREQRVGVETVAMDMWDAYRNSTLRFVPEAAAKIVYDNFHLARYMNRAVDEVRRSEMVTATREQARTLKGSRHLWLYGLENVPRRWAHRFRELRATASKTARAWKVKELLRTFWDCADADDATAYFQRWSRHAMSTRLEPVKAVVRLFRRHWANIVTYFRYHLSNAPSEGINSRIQQLVQKACGYRNRERFKADILFHLGGLDLYPAQTP